MDADNEYVIRKNVRESGQKLIEEYRKFKTGPDMIKIKTIGLVLFTALSLCYLMYDMHENSIENKPDIEYQVEEIDNYGKVQFL